jgi:hypothetical protein
MRYDHRIANIREFLADLTTLFSKLRQRGQCVRESPKESVIDGEVERFEMRLIKLHDVSYKDKGSYQKAARSTRVEKLSADKMTAVEPPMGRISKTI